MEIIIIEKLLYFISLNILFFSIFAIFVKYGSKENPLSPLNLLILSQLLTLIFQIPALFSNELYSSLQANYFMDFLYDLDFYYQSLNVLGYAFFNFALLVFLLHTKYDALKSINNYTSSLNKIELFLLSTLIFSYIIFNLRAINFQFTPQQILELRYNLEHGYDVLLLKFTNIFAVSILASIILMKKRNKIYMFMFILILIFFILWGIIGGTRGTLIYSLLFLSFIRFSRLTVVYFLRKLYRGYIHKYILPLIAVIFTISIFYYYYSISIRGYIGNFFSVISQRLDYLVASYVAMKELGPRLQLENLIYPFVSYIPRNLWPFKPFPPNAQITYEIFGYIETWSVNFGIVGESLYVLPIIWIIIAAGTVAVCLNWFRKILYKKEMNIFDIGTLTILYTYPMGVVFSGVLTPLTADIIFMLPLLKILSQLRRRRIVI